jgi:hypothetical protein
MFPPLFSFSGRLFFMALFFGSAEERLPLFSLFIAPELDSGLASDFAVSAWFPAGPDARASFGDMAGA